MKTLVVLTGAGISAESGLKTFREMGGLWEEYAIEEVASPEAWERNPGLVLDFYNERRKQLLETGPNPAHYFLSELDEYFNVEIVTQNVDDLHERAGSKNITHLHGELRKARSTRYPDLIYDIEGWELHLGDTCEKGYQLRPHIVWFGEMVPAIEDAAKIFRQADYCAVIGTSLNVYPAAGLLAYLPGETPVFLIDPNETMIPQGYNVIYIKEKASYGVEILKETLLKQEGIIS